MRYATSLGQAQTARLYAPCSMSCFWCKKLSGNTIQLRSFSYTKAHTLQTETNEIHILKRLTPWWNNSIICTLVLPWMLSTAINSNSHQPILFPHWLRIALTKQVMHTRDHECFYPSHYWPCWTLFNRSSNETNQYNFYYKQLFTISKTGRQ